MDILCRGRVLEPEVVAPPFDESDYRRGTEAEDGEIIRDRTYDQLKEERQSRGRWA